MARWATVDRCEVCATALNPTATCRVENTRRLAHLGIGLADEFEQFAEEIKPPHGHDIDHHDGQPLPQQTLAFGHEHLPTLRPILVRGTNEFDRRHQATVPSKIENAYLVFTGSEKVGLDRDAWFRGGECDTRRITPGRQRLLAIKAGNIHFDL